MVQAKFEKINCAILAFAGDTDKLVSIRAARKVLDIVSSEDKQFCVVPGGQPEGSEGGPCYSNGTCDTFLTCNASTLCEVVADGDQRYLHPPFSQSRSTAQRMAASTSPITGETANLASLDNIVERIRLFCTLYDPDEDAYRFDWSIFTGIVAGLLSILGLAAFLIHATLQHRNVGR